MARRICAGSEKLEEFISDNGLTKLAAAKYLGVSDPTIYDWVTGIKRPKSHHRRAIEIWTNGKVPAESWLFDDEKRSISIVKPFRKRTGTDG